MEVVEQTLDKVFEQLGLQKFCEVPTVQVASKTLGVPAKYLLSGTIVGVLVLILCNFAASLVINVIGFFYPAYMSYKALESAQNSEDDKQWLSYWVVYVLLTSIDSVAGVVLQMIPFYYLIKLVFFIYLFHPTYKGSLVVYNSAVAPVLRKYESLIDSQLAALESQAAKLTKKK